MKLQFFLAISFVFKTIHGLNILAVWPVPSRTHFTLGMALFNALARNEHTITLISPFEQKETHRNIKLVKLKGATESLLHGNLQNFLEFRNLSVAEMLKAKTDIGTTLTDFTLGHEILNEILSSGEKFDAFIYDVYNTDGLLIIAHMLCIPSIAFSCLGSNRLTNEMTKRPMNPSYDINMLSSMKDLNTLTNRIQNTAVTLLELYYYSFKYIPKQDQILKKHYANKINKSLPSVIDLIHNVDLVLINSHPLIQSARVDTPNSQEIGGIQLKTEFKSIHQDLNNIMDKAIRGIIYFSLGGNIQSVDLSKEKLEIFINVFTSLIPKDIVVLWKYEGINLKEKQPRNVVIGPWMPQQEILAHKNLRLFITHGGLLSLMEAVHYAKPVIGIPIFNDQKYNMAQAESQGYAIQLDYDNLTEDMLKMAIDKIFNDENYRDNATRMSEHIKDNPIRAIDKAAWYVEYVVKTNGARHLRTTATMLSFWQIHFIDQILMALIFILFVIMCIMLSIMKYSMVKFQKHNKSTQYTIKGKAATAVRGNKFKSN